MGFLHIRWTPKALTNQADKPIKVANRRGVLEGTARGGGLLNKGTQYQWVAEVEELKRVGHLSKLKFHDISGADKGMLMGIMPEWIPTNEIIWEADPKTPTNTHTSKGGLG